MEDWTHRDMYHVCMSPTFADPHWFNADTDPEFFLIADPVPVLDPGFRLEKIKSWNFLFRVSDPHWFNADPDTDPDPAFFVIADPDPGFDDLKLKKITVEKKLIFLDQRLQFTFP